MSRLTSTTATWVTLPLRLVLGSVMFAHGAQKVFGVWGGSGLSKWTSGLAPLDLRPSWAWLMASALTEFIGGAMVLIGLYTRVAALLISCVMVVAIAGVHLRNGFFLNNSGYEYAMSLLGVALALVIAGGGNASIDERIG